MDTPGTGSTGEMVGVLGRRKHRGRGKLRTGMASTRPGARRAPHAGRRSWPTQAAGAGPQHSNRRLCGAAATVRWGTAWSGRGTRPDALQGVGLREPTGREGRIDARRGKTPQGA